MAKLSLSSAWDESRGVLQHDGKLLSIVAVALIALPTTVQALVTPVAPEGELPPAGPWIAVALVALIIAFVGQLAIVRLAVGPETSVGEAIGHGARRAPPYVAALLIWLLPVVIVAALTLSVLKGDKPSGLAIIGFILLMLAIIFVAVRMVLMPAIASSERAGPIAIIQRSWTLTSGNWWRFFAFLLLFLVATLCAIIAVGGVVGGVVVAVLGRPEPMSVGALIVALASQLLVAAISVVYFVMLARIYLQLTGREGAASGVPTTGI
jgi:hypothetical protein